MVDLAVSWFLDLLLLNGCFGLDEGRLAAKVPTRPQEPPTAMPEMNRPEADYAITHLVSDPVFRAAFVG